MKRTLNILLQILYLLTYLQMSWVGSESGAVAVSDIVCKVSRLIPDPRMQKAMAVMSQALTKIWPYPKNNNKRLLFVYMCGIYVWNDILSQVSSNLHVVIVSWGRGLTWRYCPLTPWVCKTGEIWHRGWSLTLWRVNLWLGIYQHF